MFDKLEDLLIRFEEIMGELHEPTVTNNQERVESALYRQCGSGEADAGGTGS